MYVSAMRRCALAKRGAHEKWVTLAKTRVTCWMALTSQIQRVSRRNDLSSAYQSQMLDIKLQRRQRFLQLPNRFEGRMMRLQYPQLEVNISAGLARCHKRCNAEQLRQSTNAAEPHLHLA